MKLEKATYITCPHCGERTPAVERCLRCNEDFVIAGLDQTDSYNAADILQSTLRYNTLPGEAQTGKFTAIVPKDDLADVVFTGSEPVDHPDQQKPAATNEIEERPPDELEREFEDVLSNTDDSEEESPDTDQREHDSHSFSAMSEEEVIVFRPERETDSQGAVDPELAKAVAEAAGDKAAEKEARAAEALFASEEALAARRAATAINAAINDIGVRPAKTPVSVGRKRRFAIIGAIAIIVLTAVVLLRWMTPEMEEAGDEPPLGDIPGFFFVSD